MTEQQSELVLVFDTETTGFVARSHLIALEKQPYIIEFSGVIIDLYTDDPPLREVYHLIKPPIKIPREATEDSHHITDDMVKDCPSFDAVAVEIKEFLENGAPTVIAHNVSFDQEVMDIQYERRGETIAWPQLICTVEQTTFITGKRMTLTELHRHLFGTIFLDAHKAKADTMALVRCCRELARRGIL